MKKIYLSLLTALAINGASLWANYSFDIPVDIYLQNNYGAPIEYIEKADADSYLQAKGPSVLRKLDTGSSIRLSNTYGELGLSMRTIGGAFQNVSYVLEDIRRQAPQHRNDDAIIIASSSLNPYYKYYWHLSVSWRPKR
jgi:hypothetical protein